MFDQWSPISVTIGELDKALSANNLYHAARFFLREATVREAVVYYIQHKDDGKEKMLGQPMPSNYFQVSEGDDGEVLFT